MLELQSVIIKVTLLPQEFEEPFQQNMSGVCLSTYVEKRSFLERFNAIVSSTCWLRVLQSYGNGLAPLRKLTTE